MDGLSHGSGGDPEGDKDDEIDGGLRGWIPPDDRPWRHPSESGVSPPPSPVGHEAPATHRSSGIWIVTGAATACLVIALVAAGLVVASGTAEQESSETTLGAFTLTGVPTTDPGLDGMAPRGSITSIVSEVRPSTVALRIDGPNGTAIITGIVAESGGIIVTASTAVSSARAITAIEPDGAREEAQLVGVDPASGLAVVRIGDDLPVASFDADDLPVGKVAVATALVPPRQSRAMPASRVFAGTVVSTGEATLGNPITAEFSATAVRAPLSSNDVGSALLDSSGQVAGLLETTRGSGSSTMAFFLPAALVLGVTRQLVLSGSVEHGWLGVESGGVDPSQPDPTDVASTSDTDGALLGAVASGSPAASAGLEPGDLVTGVDGDPVHSTAELRSVLYAEPPGASVSITFEQDGTTITTSAVLAEPDGGAQDDDASP